MENRRPVNSNTEKPTDRDNKFQKRPSNSFYGERKFQPRGERFRPSEGESRTNSQPRNSGSQPRQGGVQGRDNRFQSRDNRSQNRDSGFQSRDNRSQNRDSGFQSRDNRFQNRDNRFPKRPFDPKGRVPSRGKSAEPAWKTEVKPKIVSEMQVTDGKHQGKYLISSSSPKIRPTTRRLREIMFRLIIRRVRARRFLDLCAGNGAVGIEAVSRGALLSTFVERSGKMCSFIRKNMASLEIKEGHGEIFELEAVPFLKQMLKRKRFWDAVFLDPPYDTDYDEILEYLKKGACVKVRGMLIIEHHAEMFFPENLGVLKRWRVIVEGESALSFYERF